jgi:glycosyltransferase involved in cell wall biosynthesis
VGLQTALIAAAKHEVWVITRENNIESLRSYLRAHPTKNPINLVGLEVHGVALRTKNLLGLASLHWYYDLWQRRLGEVAVKLDEEIGFDVVHHVTLAAYWPRIGVATVQKPLVLGPVGGGVAPPLVSLPAMGVAGAVGDLARLAIRPVIARLTQSKQVAHNAAVLLVQNPETGRRIVSAGQNLILPHSLSALASLNGQAQNRGRPTNNTETIVFAGRLIGWKAASLAIRAMRYQQVGHLALDLYGDGPQRRRLERMAIRLGVSDRVSFRGKVSREELLAAIAAASALVHPALHDDSPLVVAEALALGTPVVGVQRGGPPVISSYWPDVPSRMVKPATPGRMAEAIAIGLAEVAGSGTNPSSRPLLEYENQILAAYEEAASS